MGVNSSRQQYIEQYAGYAMEQMRRYGIPASVTLAQGIIESASGKSTLAQTANNHFGVKGTLAYGQFAGTDEGTSNPTRGYSFTSDITEISLQSEYTLYGGPYARRRTPNLVYIFAGAGILSYQPKLIRDGGPRPIDTVNGRGITPVMPFGIGYQYRFSTRFSLGAEFGWRYTFTDYLD
jgi:hypothetical protein